MNGLEVGANELIQALQNKIGQYEVEKVAAELFINKLTTHVAELENQLRGTQTNIPTPE